MSWFTPSTINPLGPPHNLAKSSSALEQTSGSSEKKEAETSSSSETSRLSLPSKKLLVLGVDFGTPAKSGRSKGRTMKNDGKVFSLETPFYPSKMTTNNQVYKFVQQVSIGTNASSTTLNVFTGTFFTLSQIDQVAQLQAVFDQYRIDEIEFWIWPRAGNQNVGASVDQGLLASVVDYDDASSLSSFASALDYSNVCVTSGRDGHYRRFKPHVAVAAYSGAFTSFANEESPWLDMASPGVQHYGVKTAWTPTDVVYGQSFQARFHLSCRNVR